MTRRLLIVEDDAALAATLTKALPAAAMTSAMRHRPTRGSRWRSRAPRTWRWSI